ncbi:MAG: DNA-binding protein [Ruminococcus sp.]|nr:DNA-binding protein [Ruminococcus sp.]MBQ4171769.1 DNA-binding protein [Ruminococcus sp.]
MTTNNNNVIRTLPRMRTIPKAYAEIKALDSGTSFSMRALRRMVKSGEMPTVTVGNKQLINLDLLIQKISGFDDGQLCG